MRVSQIFGIVSPVLGITASAASLSSQLQNPSRCGTEIDEHFAHTLKRVKAHENTIKKLRARDDVDSGLRGSLPAIDVTVHFHTVSSTDKVDAITDDALNAQFDVLQKTYAEYDINLHWSGTVASRTVDDWLALFHWPITRDQVTKKKQFLTSTRQGGYNVLNFYFYTGMSVGAWGSCNVAKENVTTSFDNDIFREDGCNINYLALPGGNPIVNLGYTAVHEAGHWFGLQHVFTTFACDDVGDDIDDTPATSEPTSGCPIGKDSCPDMPGLDPIHNFMDYSDDSCFTEFTRDQKIRMHATWTTLRSNLTSLPQTQQRRFVSPEWMK